MELYNAEEVLTDILQGWRIIDLYYFDFYKNDLEVRYGRKGYDYKRKMSKEEFDKLLKIIEMFGYLDYEGVVNIY